MAAPPPQPDFVRTLGLPFLAHLLRRISDRMVADAGAFEAELGVSAPPRTASTMLLLRAQGAQSVMRIAEQLRQSHPLVISWIRQLEALGLVAVAADPRDRRRTLVELTAAGMAEADRMAALSALIGEAYRALLAEADAELSEGLWRLHDLLARGRLAELLRSMPNPLPGEAPAGEPSA